MKNFYPTKITIKNPYGLEIDRFHLDYIISTANDVKTNSLNENLDFEIGIPDSFEVINPNETKIIYEYLFGKEVVITTKIVKSVLTIRLSYGK